MRSTRQRLAAALLAAALLAARGAAGQETPSEPARPEHVFGERIDVHRVIVDLRVIDGRGEPVAGLGPGDFEVRLDGRPVEVEAVEWRADPGGDDAGLAPAYLERTDPGPAPAAAPAPVPAPAEPPALLVVFFQSADFYMGSKAVGHLRMLPRIEELVANLGPGERAAVLRYGGSLRLETDFTADRERLLSAVRRSVLGGERPPIEGGPGPSLAAHLDPAAARRAATPERALAVAAEALGAIPGAKTMVFVGWGLGDHSRRTGLASKGRDLDEAHAALAAARIAVFVLDVTSADSHTLEPGLRHLAHVTGGTYASTYHHPGGALRQLERALAGRYTLVLLAPRLDPGRHPLRVRLAPGVASLGRWVLAPEAVYVPAAKTAEPRS